MSRYTEFRKGNISLLIKERDAEMKLHGKLQGSLDESLAEFQDETKRIAELAPEIRGTLAEIESLRLELTNEGNVKKYFKSMAVKLAGSEIDINKSTKEALKKLKEIHEEEDRKFIIESKGVQSKTKSLRRKVIKALSQNYFREQGINLLNEIDQFSEQITIGRIDEIERLFNVVNSGAPERIFRLAKNYIGLISEQKPEIKRERLKEIARLNVDYLERTLEQEREEKAGYFDSLEGRVLAYATYALELKGTDGKEETEEDLDYQIFLEEKVEEAFGKLDGFETIISQIKILEERGRITEDDLVYLSVKLKSFYEKDKVDEKPNEEDIILRGMILEHDFGIKPKKSREISRLISDDLIFEVYKSLSLNLGDKKAKELLRTNPDLFYMDESTLERYVQLARDLAERTRKYPEIDEFDFEENPEGFASFEALHKTGRKIDGLEKRVLQGAQTAEELKIMISRKALERAKKDNYVFENRGKYLREISIIAKDPLGRTKREKVGDFNVSPMGRSRKGFRVAWHYEGATNTLFIDDLLYHESQYKYVDDWNHRAPRGKIKIEDYESIGFENFTGKI